MCCRIYNVFFGAFDVLVKSTKVCYFFFFLQIVLHLQLFVGSPVDTPPSMLSGFGSVSYANIILSLFILFLQFILLGAVPFQSDVPRLKELGVCGVITLTEPYETLVPSSLYKVCYFLHLLI